MDMLQQETAPDLCDMLNKIRKAKDASGLTNQELADIANISYNSVCTITGCTAKQVTLTNAAALCAALGISLDELAGLRDTDEAEYIHSLELDNACLRGSVEHYKRVGAVCRQFILGLVSVAALLICVIIGYIIFDIQLKHMGLFQSGGLTALAVMLGVIVLSALVLMVFAIKTVIRDTLKSGRKK